jgi:hypothetical protein
MLNESTHLFSSNDADIVLNNGSTFNVNLNHDSLAIPNTGKCPTIAVHHARVWWVMPNLSATTFKFRTIALATETGPIPKGLYDLPQLASAIATEIGNIEMPVGLFTFSGNAATQKVQITFNVAGYKIDFTNSAIGLLMGFDSALYPAAYSFAGQTITAPNSATFNTISSFFIKMSGLRKGIPTNGNSSGVLCEVLIDKPAGSQILFEPKNMIKIPCPELQNGGLSVVQFSLTDQNGNAVDTNGETWSFTCTLSWYQ